MGILETASTLMVCEKPLQSQWSQSLLSRASWGVSERWVVYSQGRLNRRAPHHTVSIMAEITGEEMRGN